MSDISAHIFYFPFTWESMEDLSKFKPDPVSGWEHVAKSDNVEVEYNERNFFYQYVHEKIYDESEKNVNGSSLIYHYEQESASARYSIVVKWSEWANGALKHRYMTEYDLKVEAINLNLYPTGIGLLSIYTSNDTAQCKESKDGAPMEVRSIGPDDVLRINQFGRRIMPPFFKDLEYRSETAASLKLSGLKIGEIKEDFSSYKDGKSWQKPCQIVERLITSLIKDIKYRPVIDDRMYVMSWYKNTSLVSNAVKDYESDNNFWYRFLYVDTGSPMCQDPEKRRNLLKEHTYRRWADYGSLYGVTRYSMVFLAGEGAEEFLFDNFKTIYARMVELVLMQRATVLKFSERINDISNHDDEESKRKLIQTKVNNLCREYIVFKNQFYFKEITAQEQGIELYDMLQQSLRLADVVKDLDDDIQELYQYHSILEEQDGNRKAQTLNFIMSIFTPASCMAAFLAVGGWKESWKCGNLWLDWLGVAAMILLSVVTVTGVLMWNRRNKRVK